jgi:hypothetical protein
VCLPGYGTTAEELDVVKCVIAMTGQWAPGGNINDPRTRLQSCMAGSTTSKPGGANTAVSDCDSKSQC